MSEPVRTCVACRTRRPQRALVRLRRRSDGVVVPAVGRRTHGRSAYLCPSHACLARALRRRALERALGQTPRGGGPRVAGRAESRPDEGTVSSARTVRVRSPEPQALWSAVAAALDHEIQNMQRSGAITPSPRLGELEELRRGLDAPGRSA